jgi:hypothetical protein
MTRQKVATASGLPVGWLVSIDDSEQRLWIQVVPSLVIQDPEVIGFDPQNHIGLAGRQVRIV